MATQYEFTVEKVHENILIKSHKDRKNHLDKLILLQIFVKRRWEVRHNVRSQRDSKTLYYIGVKAEGFRLSPELSYKFRLFNTHAEAIRNMRKNTNKAIRKKEFKFITDPSVVRIKSLETLHANLNSQTRATNPQLNQTNTAFAPRPSGLAVDVLNNISPDDHIKIDNSSKDMIVRIL